MASARRLAYRPAMRRFGLIGLHLCILAIWMQIFAPLAAMSMERADRFDPFSAICSHAKDGGQAPSDHHHHDHQHCLLCHAQLVGTTPDDRPAFTTLDYPIASPLRWTLRDVAPRRIDLHRTAQPRGPPTLI